MKRKTKKQKQIRSVLVAQPSFVSCLSLYSREVPARSEPKLRAAGASRSSEPVAPPCGHVAAVPLVPPGGAATRTPGVRPTELCYANFLGLVPMVGWTVNGKQSKSKWFLFLDHTRMSTHVTGATMRRCIVMVVGKGCLQPVSSSRVPRCVIIVVGCCKDRPVQRGWSRCRRLLLLLLL